MRVHTAGINHLDLFILGGLPGITYTFPHIVGSDAAGVVESVGPEVTGWAVGRPGDDEPRHRLQRVRRSAPPTSSRSAARYGLLGEHVPGTVGGIRGGARPATSRGCPRQMPWAQAAGFSLATLTAWRMMTARARVRAGETVLIWGIGGGVAQACLQIAKLLGATVIVTSSSDAKLERARALGADHLLNHAARGRAEGGPRPHRRPQRRRGGGQRRREDLAALAPRAAAAAAGSSPAAAPPGRWSPPTCGSSSGTSGTSSGSTMGGDREYQEVARHAARGAALAGGGFGGPAGGGRGRLPPHGRRRTVRQTRDRGGTMNELWERLSYGMRAAQLLPSGHHRGRRPPAGRLFRGPADREVGGPDAGQDGLQPGGQGGRARRRDGARRAVARSGARGGQAGLLAGDAGRHPAREHRARAREHQRDVRHDARLHPDADQRHRHRHPRHHRRRVRARR